MGILPSIFHRFIIRFVAGKGKRFLIQFCHDFRNLIRCFGKDHPLAGTLSGEVKPMAEYLCLTELLDQDLSAYEFFQTLAPMLQDQLRQEGDIRSFAELQVRAAQG